MNTLKLIEPTIALEKQYDEMLQEWLDRGENLVPFVLKFDSSDFKKLIEQLDGFKNGVGIPKEFVSHSTFWLADKENKILGVVNIRHKLTESLFIEGGHIGYGIRPLERRKGYATKILELALLEAKKLGITKAMVTCDKDNEGSKKTILKNNGKLFQENISDGKAKLGFWIEIL